MTVWLIIGGLIVLATVLFVLGLRALRRAEAGTSMRTSLFGSYFVTVTVLVGAGVLGAGISSAQEDVDSTLNVSQQIASATPERELVQYDAPFTSEMLVDVAQYSSQLSSNRPAVDATLVNGTEGADYLETAQGCIEYLLATYTEAEFIQCFVFADWKTYEFQNFTEDLEAQIAAGNLPEERTFGVSNVCWQIQAIVDGRASEPAITDLRGASFATGWEQWGCPT